VLNLCDKKWNAKLLFLIYEILTMRVQDIWFEEGYHSNHNHIHRNGDRL
jgi:hypothetical protein